MKTETKMMTPAGNEVNQKIDAPAALRKAATLARLQHAEPANSETLYALLCSTGAGASIRFRCFEWIRLVAIGTKEAGDLSGAMRDMSCAQLAGLLDGAAQMAS